MTARIDDIEHALELIGQWLVDLDRRVREVEAEHAEAMRDRDRVLAAEARLRHPSNQAHTWTDVDKAKVDQLRAGSRSIATQECDDGDR